MHDPSTTTIRHLRQPPRPSKPTLPASTRRPASGGTPGAEGPHPCPAACLIDSPTYIGEAAYFELPRARPHRRRRRLLRLYPAHDDAHCGEQTGGVQPPRCVPDAVAACAPGQRPRATHPPPFRSHRDDGLADGSCDRAASPAVRAARMRVHGYLDKPRRRRVRCRSVRVPGYIL